MSKAEEKKSPEEIKQLEQDESQEQPQLVKMVWLKGVRYNGERREAGQRVEVSEEESQRLLDLKVARLLEV